VLDKFSEIIQLIVESTRLIDINLNIADLPLLGMDGLDAFIVVRSSPLALVLHIEDIPHEVQEISLILADLPRPT
jgi:hypothetical protein